MATHILSGMDKISVELRLLANFVSACQHSRVSEAALALGHTPSALSTALHNLEERFGLRLFVRQGSSLGLLPAAFWLFRNACQLLYLESYARGTLSLPHSKLDRLVVRLDLSPAIGRFSKALVRATLELTKRHPETFVEWRFAGLQDRAQDEIFSERSGVAFEGSGETVSISYQPPDGNAGEPFHLANDPWIITGSADREVRLSQVDAPVVVMRMRPHLLQAISAYAQNHSLDGRLKFVEDDPSQLGRLLQEFPQTRFLMPASLIADRMGLSRLDWAPLSPLLVSPLHGFLGAAPSAKGRLFLELLKRELGSEERSVDFDPQMTVRQLQYFNLSYRTGGIAAAARAAHGSQSAVSAQIHKLETSVGGRLLQRHQEGQTLSPAGARLLPFTLAIEERLSWLIRQSTDIAAHTQASIKIGTLPSSGHDSALTDKIARAMTTIHANYPTWKLQVSEGSNQTLHEKIRAGELNLAIVGAAQAQASRISLGPSEPLSVVAHPSVSLPNRHEMSVAEVCGLPLVLGAGQLSIHQIFAQAAKARKISITPVIEVGSLALAIAMVRSSRLCTVLPASSVRKDVEAGLLATVPIRRDEVPGALSIIFSSDRALSDAERTIIQELVRAFKSGRE
ncbi:LysR family transcriptional regulator [Rhizobium sp. 2MFCol3.1]|uniref:LysR family transcriptional regulator n=1 Tax=Rhizobium sp. 2MFCol3.1 TaxID=1246459 RepID=UPI00036FB0BA|nr:LysR family transcriptional regulator [Rhizobium sp. 2MFCol3.1]